MTIGVVEKVARIIDPLAFQMMEVDERDVSNEGHVAVVDAIFKAQDVIDMINAEFKINISY